MTARPVTRRLRGDVQGRGRTIATVLVQQAGILAPLLCMAGAAVSVVLRSPRQAILCAGAAFFFQGQWKDGLDRLGTTEAQLRGARYGMIWERMNCSQSSER